MLVVIISYDQAALRTLQSVRPSVCPFARMSVCHTFSQCSFRRIIMEFSGGITIDKSDIDVKGQGQRSEAKATEVKTNFTPIWAFPGGNSSLNSQMATQWCTKLVVA